MLVSSRSFEEYVAMFGLDSDDLPARVLDCSAGAACFVADAHERGVAAIAVDPAYASPLGDLRRLVRSDLTGCVNMVQRDVQHFTWEWYGSLERREQMRHDAAEAFLADRQNRPSHYIAASLPQLPFGVGSFELAVCSHLLFTWSPELDHEWHRDALVELTRVAREVRVFPLVVRRTGQPVEFLPALRDELTELGISSDVRTVPYEFQRQARQMLVLSAAG